MRRIAIGLLLFLCACMAFTTVLFSMLKHRHGVMASVSAREVVFPWDPLEWDTLRDSPLVYKSLGESFDAFPLYKPFLDDKKSVGLTLDASYFNTILSHVKDSYVKEISEKELLEGCEKELSKLFKEAGIKEKPSLAGYSLDKEFIDKVVKQYGSQVDGNILIFASIRGILRGLGDPYSNLLVPKDYSTLMERLQEKSFGGVGIYIELDSENHDSLTVLEPIEGTPAHKAGLMPGDVIEEINGESTKDISIYVAVAKLRGPRGTTVKLSVRRKGVAKPLSFVISRDNINSPSVSWKVIHDDVGYVRLRSFGTETEREFDEALDSFSKQNVKYLVMDLRNNGGGYLNAAVEISSKFLSPDRTVFKRIDRNGRVEDFGAKRRDRVSLPLVVLVNRFSASSSEIVAGAIKDNHAGTLIGDRTFGKGSVQQIYSLAENSALKLTVSYFTTPGGKIINKKGLKPHIYSPMKPNLVGKDKDSQLEEAVTFLKKGVHAGP
ncbi:MAG: S41 family peptidase [Candidatus Eremiobacteraeota bacterium]|nr:S41 family peptidase [Candidatus Eremiobacteraeota bacterium]